MIRFIGCVASDTIPSDFIPNGFSNFCYFDSEVELYDL